MNRITSLVHGPYPKMQPGYAWLVVIPASAWAISTIYIPLFSNNLGRGENWAVTATSLALIGLSVLGHVAAHRIATRAFHSRLPERLPIFIYGEAAQSWPPPDAGWKDAASAAAGPLANLLFSGLAYLVWDAQAGVFLNLVALLLAVFNLWLVALNLLPAFPMDGGRILRAMLLSRPASAASVTTWIRRFGFIVCLAMAGWAAFLFLQHARFSAETAGITLALALLLLEGLTIRPALDTQTPDEERASTRLGWPRVISSVLLGALMLVAFASTLMTNEGLDAPGLALSVEPMVNVPAQYRHAHTGTFLLTTVFSHAPILLGEWMVAHVDHAMTILPPEVVVPKNTSVQEQARKDYQMLDESEATAIAVGLRLAGYQTDMRGKGVFVAAILPESHANGILKAGDVITALNGQPVRTTDDLIRLVKAQPATAPVKLEVARGASKMSLSVPLMPPDASSSTPRIGISIQSAGFDFKPPFPVSIATQKINGGPSAGLMFTLTIYNALSSKDLTGGRRIAGTGTISLDGTVGPIGGVKQKVAAAEAAGAAYFLCPVENYSDAVSVARSIQVIEVAHVQDALNFLNK